MRSKKNTRSDFVACLHNFEPIIAQFPIKTGAYGEVLLDYFRVCPYVQSLEIDWSKISQELSSTTSSKVIPQWSCSNYNKCNHNERCQPPYRYTDTEHKYLSVADRDHILFVNETDVDGEKRRVQKSSIGKFLIECKDKVLVSPDRFDKLREKCMYSLDQIANMCGLTKQALSVSNLIQENPKQKLNCIAAKNRMVTRKYSACCLLAILFEVTPGYLMGQTDDPDKDIYVRRNTYYTKELVYQNGTEATIKTTSPVHEEYEVCGELFLPIKLFSQKKREGRMAADRIRGYSKQLSPNFQQLLELCEKIYYQPIPQKLKEDLSLFFEGLLDNSNTISGDPGIRDVVQSSSLDGVQKES